MSTNVLWAGNIAGAPVVSIFNNPVGYQGNDYPVYNRFDAMDRIYLDSRFNYLEVKWSLDFSYKFDLIQSGNEGSVVTTVGYHNFGYPPIAILLDYDTREIITNNNYVQVIGTSYRALSFLIDPDKFYIKEEYTNKNNNLPGLTRRYTLLAFNNSAQA